MAYLPLVLILGLPISIADCGAGADDIEAACAAASRASLVYYSAATAVLLASAWAQWRGWGKPIAILLGGSILPLIVSLTFLALAY
jgi:hypothetical protein